MNITPTQKTSKALKQLTDYGPWVSGWGGGMSAGCTVGPIVRWRGQWMAA